MTLNEINQEIENIKSELDNPKEEAAFLYISNFIKNNKINQLSDFADVDIWEFVKCNFYITAKNKTIGECSSIIDDIKPIFSTIKNSALEIFLKKLIMIRNEEKIDLIINFFKCKEIKEEFKYLLEINDKKIIALLMVLKKENEDGKGNIIPFLESVKENGSVTTSQLYLYLQHEEFKDFYEHTIVAICTDGKSIELREEKKNEVVTKFAKELVDTDYIIERMDEIKRFKENYEREEKRKEKEIYGIINAKNLLEIGLNKKEIVTYREIVKTIKNEKLKNYFLEIIKEHNEKYLHELEQEIDRLKKNSKESIENLLSSNGLQKEDIDINKIMNFSYEEIEEILRFFRLLEISNNDKARILQNTSINIIRDVKDLIDKEIISPKNILENIQLLDLDSNSLKFLKSNLSLFKENGIPIEIFKQDLRILIHNSQTINKSLEILKEYNLIELLRNSSSYEFLLRDDLREVIDAFLELGYENLLISDLSLLNTKVIKRLYIIKSMNISITSKQDLLYILDEKKHFFVADEKIDEYLNEELSDNEVNSTFTIDNLEKYKSSERVYDLNGIKISIPKVKRQLESGESIYKAIIYKSILSAEELENINEILLNDDIEQRMILKK